MACIDAHAHLHPGAAADLVRTLDRVQVDRAVVVAGGVVSPAQLSKLMIDKAPFSVDADNETVLAQCRTYADRLIPFYFANPHRRPNPYVNQGMAFRGLKLAPVISGVSFLDSRTVSLVRAAERFRHPVYTHCVNRPGNRVEDLVTLARDFRGVSFILGHAGIGHCDFHGLGLIAGEPNIHLETSGGFTALVQAAVRTLGAGRVLFGSEYPLQNPQVELTKIECLDLTGEQRARVMGTNLLALVGEA